VGAGVSEGIHWRARRGTLSMIRVWTSGLVKGALNGSDPYAGKSGIGGDRQGKKEEGYFGF